MYEKNPGNSQVYYFLSTCYAIMLNIFCIVALDESFLRDEYANQISCIREKITIYRKEIFDWIALKFANFCNHSRMNLNQS